MTSEEYTILYEKYLAGTCTSAEIQQLKDYRDKFKMQEPNGKLLPEERDIKTRVYHRINYTIFNKPARVINMKFIWAAAILFIGIGMAIIFIKNRPPQIAENHIAKIKPQAIKPGRNTAVLTLANGSKIQLDDAKDGVLANVGKAAIKKVKNGEIVYDDANHKANANTALNTLAVPRGGQYNITLSDGTRVWLNSVSSLTYPANFSGNERVVELTGEAYFEVAHNEKMPFRVKTRGAEVKVLGTHFNISAYDDEPVAKTTLLEGSVQLSTKNSDVMLTPGQQGITRDNNDRIRVKDVKIAEVVAWKNGSFVFRHANIQDIMKQVSRWYDVDVEYLGNVRDQYFGGTYSKYKDITELLKGLELTGAIHFKIEGRRIIAMP
jgi:transmembrane sensor